MKRYRCTRLLVARRRCRVRRQEVVEAGAGSGRRSRSRYSAAEGRARRSRPAALRRQARRARVRSRRSSPPAKKLGDADVAAAARRARSRSKTDAGRSAGVRAAADVAAAAAHRATRSRTTFPPPPSSLLPPAANDAGKDLGPALHARGRGAARARALGDVQPADGRGDVAGRRREDAAGEADAEPKGKWRWIGTRTILFDPEVRVPAGDDVQGRGPRRARRARPAAR